MFEHFNFISLQEMASNQVSLESKNVSNVFAFVFFTQAKKEECLALGH